MAWRRAALLALAVALPARVCALEFNSHLVVLAPAETAASLAVAHDPSSRAWRVEASHDEVLVVQSATAEVSVPGVDLSHVSLIQATWVPSMGPSALLAPHVPPPLARSTFERLFGAASPSSLPFLFSTGVHVGVAVASAGVESHTVARDLLAALAENTTAPVRSLLQEMRGAEASQVLARSLCASSGFTRHQTPDQRTCFSSSFELTEAVWPLFSGEWAPAFASVTGARPTLTAVTLRASTHDPSLLKVELVSAFVTLSSSLDSSALAPPLRPQHRVVAVKAIDSGNSVASVVSLTDESETVQRLPPANTAVNAAIAVSVLGEGFHRRARVEFTSDRLCAAEEMGSTRVLLVVPLSTSIYADLDELRRMQRFGELKLHSPTKHIEIERPMAVSTQHVIALEFGIDANQHLHTLEFPIHLRYQSPSNSTMYAAATLMAPEVFVSCGNTPEKEPIVLDGPLEQLFARWHGVDAWEATGWRRVVPPSPVLPVLISVPVGFTPHGSLVSAVTLSVTGLGALLLVYVALTAPKRTREASSTWRPKTA